MCEIANKALDLVDRIITRLPDAGDEELKALTAIGIELSKASHPVPMPESERTAVFHADFNEIDDVEDDDNHDNEEEAEEAEGSEDDDDEKD